MTVLYFDCETYSECDLKSAGTHRYAEHPSTEITVVQWAIDDGEPQVQDMTVERYYRPELAQALDDPTVTVIAHNSHFDRTVLRHVWNIDVPVERWQDTMVKALLHGLPGGLERVGEVLGLGVDQAKDKRGKQLIQMFCKPYGTPAKRRTRETHPQEWAEFLEYSRQDIVAMRAIDGRLPSWNYRSGNPELALWHLDQRINDRGFAVDLDLARSATAAAELEKKRLKNEVIDLTDGAVTSVSKRDVLLQHIVSHYGVDLPDMRADTLRRRIEDPELPEAVKLLLSIRLEATKTSTAKYTALVRAASADGRLRNTLQFAGALRTSRWAGRVFQPQNMPRPTMDAREIEVGIDALKAGCADLVFDDVMGLTANAVRGCIVAPPGKKLCIADLSNIEGRSLAWLAGESWKLKAFADFDAGVGEDLYKVAYARSFNINPKDAVGQKRQIGKVMELGLGYEGGVAAFLTFAAVYNMNLADLAAAVHATASPDALTRARGMYEWAKKNRRALGLDADVYVACEVLKTAWREAHPATVALWHDVGDTVRQTIRTPGARFTVRSLVIQRDGAWLRIRLPAGRVLCYLQPQVDDRDQISYMGINQYTRKWERIKTYGGKLVENCIAKDTPVLTSRGWVLIQHVLASDKVWDGVAWVQHAGVVYKGNQKVLQTFGVTMTPDHLVLTEGGWRRASSCEGYNRAACRLPDGVAIPRKQRNEIAVGSPMRLWARRSKVSFGDAKAKEAGDNIFLRVYAPTNNREEANDPRHVEASRFCRVAFDDRQVPSSYTSRMEKLRRAWGQSVRPLAQVIQKLLGRYGADVSTRFLFGATRQLKRLLPGELCLAHADAPGEQHTANSEVRHTARAHVGIGSRPILQDRQKHVGIQTDARLADRKSGIRATGCAQSAVYDLIDCGPRNRFVVLGDNGPVIVHNCTQAFARDVLAYNMPAIEQEGYEIVLSVHDELLTETPDTEGYTHKRLAEMMSTVPSWARGLPLAAAGFETHRYRKD
jgi:DNA polymerase